MHKPISVLALFLAGSLILPSCTKDLKNDAHHLSEELKKLKELNDSLQRQTDNIIKILGTEDSVVIKTSYNDHSNQVYEANRVYKFKKRNETSQLLRKHKDGKYDIRIERYSDLEGYEYARIDFVYDPATKTISEKAVEHNWANPFTPGYILYKASPSEGLTLDIAVQSLDVTTGDISIKVNAAGTSEYTKDAEGPFPGQPIKTALVFKGRLVIVTE